MNLFLTNYINLFIFVGQFYFIIALTFFAYKIFMSAPQITFLPSLSFVLYLPRLSAPLTSYYSILICNRHAFVKAQVPEQFYFFSLSSLCTMFMLKRIKMNGFCSCHILLLTHISCIACTSCTLCTDPSWLSCNPKREIISVDCTTKFRQKERKEKNV